MDSSEKEEKMVMNSEVKEEDDEEAKAMDVSEQQNPSSSNPSPSGDDNLKSPSKRQKQKHVSEGHDQITPSRHSSESTDDEEAQDAEEYDDWDDEFDSLSDEDQYWPDEVLLFEIQIPRSNRLVIPARTAAAYFPPMAAPPSGAAPKKVETLQLTDSENLEWYMPVTFYRDERAFMILGGWQEYVNLYNLKPFDLIRFYRPVPRLHTCHFLIEHESKEQEYSRADTPEFLPENFLFRLELESSDIGYRRIFIPKEEVTNHFPEIKITRRNKMTMKFTDAQNKDWYMDIILYNPYSYMIIDGWSGFVKEHDLEAMDVINFYKPVQPCHKKHFLIEYVKREGEKGGDRGGRSYGGGGGGGGKGKEIDAGIQSRAPGQTSRCAGSGGGSGSGGD